MSVRMRTRRDLPCSVAATALVAPWVKSRPRSATPTPAADLVSTPTWTAQSFCHRFAASDSITLHYIDERQGRDRMGETGTGSAVVVIRGRAAWFYSTSRWIEIGWKGETFFNGSLEGNHDSAAHHPPGNVGRSSPTPPGHCRVAGNPSANERL